MFIFDKSKTKEEKLDMAKEAVKLGILLALDNNPTYKIAIQTFCSVVKNSGISVSIADRVAEELKCEDNPAAMQLIKSLLVMNGFYAFDTTSQIEIVNEICSLVQ